MRVLICGSRDWPEPGMVDIVVAGLKAVLGPDTVVIHGAARGADTAAQHAAFRQDLTVESFPADWDTHGKAAGPIRNQRMLEAEPDLVFAFTDDLAASCGTADMVRRAKTAGVAVYVIGRAP